MFLSLGVVVALGVDREPIPTKARSVMEALESYASNHVDFHRPEANNQPHLMGSVSTIFKQMKAGSKLEYIVMIARLALPLLEPLGRCPLRFPW